MAEWYYESVQLSDFFPIFAQVTIRLSESYYTINCVTKVRNIMNNNDLHLVTFSQKVESKRIQIFQAKTDIEALQFATSLHNASNCPHVIRICVCKDSKYIPYCTLIRN